MNILAGALLTVYDFDEEAVFAGLVGLLALLPTDYYSDSMLGALVDARVLEGTVFAFLCITEPLPLLNCGCDVGRAGGRPPSSAARAPNQTQNKTGAPLFPCPPLSVRHSRTRGDRLSGTLHG